MLFADKQALETNLQVELLRIREKELSYYTNNCLSVGMSAALLAGFGRWRSERVPCQRFAHLYSPRLCCRVRNLQPGTD